MSGTQATRENSGPQGTRFRIEFSVLVAALIAAGGVWGFVELLEWAGASAPHGVDERILLAFRVAGHPDDPIGPAWAEEAVRDVTSLGSVAVLVLILFVSTLYMLLSGRALSALYLLVATGGGQILSSLLKTSVDRPRPDLVPHLAQTFTQSFPSGHAFLSAVTYLTLGALLARVMPGRALKAFAVGVGVLLTVLVGLSRIYLGVHWPSDVAAGWCAGAAWAMLCWLAARWVLSRRRPGETAVTDASHGPR